MKVYAYGVAIFKKGEPNHHYLSGMMELEKLIRDYREGEEQKEQVNFLHGLIREKLRLPNEIFAIGSNKDGSNGIIIFHKKPDGNTYHVFKDEDIPYIIVEGDDEDGNNNNE